MTKIILIILVLVLTSSCNLHFGKPKDFEKNSEEANLRLKTQLRLENEESISDLNYFMDETGIDPYYVASFKTNYELIKKVVQRLNMTIDTTGKYIWIPEESPSWFAPPIDYKNNEFPTYILEKPGKKEFLYFNQITKICYYGNLSW